MMLTDAKARAAKPREKVYSLPDERGLHLFVLTTGRKMWRVRYTRDGKRTWFTVGEYPSLSILKAREALWTIRQRLFEGLPLDPSTCINTRFGDIAEAWVADHDSKLSTELGRKKIRQRMENHLLPYLADRDIQAITPSEVLGVLNRIAAAGHYDMMTRIRSIISQIFRYAAANDIEVADPTTAIKGAITVPKPKHYASVKTEGQVARLLRAIDAYPSDIVRRAMLFSAYTFCRPGEIRRAEWAEINFEKAEWRIPEEKMKMRRPHIVPLAPQVVHLLKTMDSFNCHGRYVFPSPRVSDGSRPMSDATITVALRLMGFEKREMTAHGFRSMASTILNENGFNSDWIERQLAHVEGNKVRAAYNYADYLDDRRKMMQWYADYLDSLIR